MVKPPPRADEEIAKAAMLDIAGNVTGRDQWKDYDERYVTQRILRAKREAKGAAVLAFFLIPFAVHAQNFTYKGVIVHQGTATKCIGPEVHAPPCLPDDVGYIDDQQRIHFTKNLSEAEQCELIGRLSQHAMVLHLIPIDRDDPFDALRDEIRLSPTDPKPLPPRMNEWTADTKEQTITHIASGCRFHAYRLKPPLVQGFVLPFEHSYEIVVRFVGMADNANLPSVEHVKELGRQGLLWITTFTAESAKHKQ